MQPPEPTQHQHGGNSREARPRLSWKAQSSWLPNCCCSRSLETCRLGILRGGETGEGEA
jgi:hypothetical protein